MNVTWLLVKRDFIERIRQRSFIIVTILSVCFIIGSALLIPLSFGLLATEAVVNLAVVAPDAATQVAIATSLSKSDYKITLVGGRPTGPALPVPVHKALDADKYDAALVAYRDRSGQLSFAYYPKKPQALQSSDTLKSSLLRAVLVSSGGAAMERKLKYPFSVHSLNKRYKTDTEQIFAQVVSYFLLIMLYIAVVVYGNTVAHGVIEEKANRVMEIMIGAVRPSQLLAGKIFGIGSLALLQLAINAAAAAVATVLYGIIFAGTMAEKTPSLNGQSAAQQAALGQALAGVPWSTLAFLVVFFLLGFFTFAALYAGVGSLLSKPEGVQQYASVFMIPVIGAYVLAIFAIENPDMPAAVYGSMIPIVSPLLMFTRIATSAVPPWQIVISIGASLAAIWGLTALAGKLYRIGVLMYGKPPRPSEIWRALRAQT